MLYFFLSSEIWSNVLFECFSVVFCWWVPECLRVVPVWVHARVCASVFYKDVWVKGWTQNDYREIHLWWYSVHGLPATSLEQHKPRLVFVCCSASHWFSLFFCLFWSLLSFLNPPGNPCKRQVHRVHGVVWSSLRNSAVFLALSDTDWSLDGTDGFGIGIGFSLGWKLRCRRASTYLQSPQIFFQEVSIPFYQEMNYGNGDISHAHKTEEKLGA